MFGLSLLSLPVSALLCIGVEFRKIDQRYTCAIIRAGRELVQKIAGEIPAAYSELATFGWSVLFVHEISLPPLTQVSFSAREAAKGNDDSTLGGPFAE